MKEETQSPSISTKSLFLTCFINAMEECQVVTCDVPGVFMQADIDEILHIKLAGEIAELLVKGDPSYPSLLPMETGRLSYMQS